MKTAKQHPHAAFIAEAILDISREIYMEDKEFGWGHGTLQDAVEDSGGNLQFRFADTAEQNHKIVSSLTDDELERLYNRESSFEKSLRGIANAAVQRAIEELKDPPLEWWSDWGDTVHIAQVAIQEYIRAVQRGKL